MAVAFYSDNLSWAACNSTGRMNMDVHFGIQYRHRLKGVPMHMEFCFGMGQQIYLLVSLYKQGLVLLSPADLD
jgi:hypothetical protein